jgi:hypothetical protein
MFFKLERGFYYLVFPQQNPLGDFQNSSPVGYKVILNLTTKPVICGARPVASVQENPLRKKSYAHHTTRKKNPLRDEIHCAMKSTT